MKRFIASFLMLSMVSLGMIGCSEKSSSSEKSVTTTPDGTTTVTVTKEVEKAGENPPPVKP